ncbi:hypothetical protein [Agromyces ramosus]|uniref:Uncharacterized protein n=1 Tax=Agromyces ramosus TaxID=33879 RepID=A0ABU0RB46_9MICO|nr:hypothetical protein [Agromyces ramosus]MDQ0894431.1 hypothetical protein [Agromyces ramosus]
MAPKINTPVKGFTGIVAGVSFANGTGETDDPIALAYFERRGYDIEVTEAELAAAEEAEAERIAAEQAAAEEAALAAAEAEKAAEAAKATPKPSR